MSHVLAQLLLSGIPFFANVSGFDVVVGQQPLLRFHGFTEARVPKLVKVTKLMKESTRGRHPRPTIILNIQYIVCAISPERETFARSDNNDDNNNDNKSHHSVREARQKWQ